MFRHKYFIFFGLILIGYVSNLTTDIMEIDAAQYASISREMAETGHYLQVYQRGQDYLDKPPLLFWLSSMSIGIGGNTNIAYKVIPILFLLIALFATYRFALLWYDQRTSLLAALMLGTTQAFLLMSNDIRTDGLLTAFIMLSTWMISSFLQKRKMIYLVVGGVCIGGAMLAKGPVGLFIPAVAIGGHLLLSGQWKKIFDPVWLLLIPIIAVVIAPMCYGLYMQFDLHPEKEVYGLKGPSGLGFYFWTQSFGRITGDNTWTNNTPWYYFLQTILWDMQPWILIFIPAIGQRIKEVWKIRTTTAPATEWISFSGFILPLIALSCSGYKLQHYIFPVFPFAAVILAAHLTNYLKQLPKWLEYFQLGIIHLLLIVSLAMMFWVFPVQNGWLPLIWGVLYISMWWWKLKATDDTDRWILPSLTGAIIFQLCLSFHFYPHLLQYQSSSQAGKYIAEHPLKRVYWHDKYGYALDYYSGKAIPNAFGPPVDTLAVGSWIYVSSEAVATMPPHKVLKEFEDYQVSKLNTGFLNPATRKEKIKKMYLVELTERE